MIYKDLKEKYKILPVQVKVSIWALICGVLQKGIGILTTPIFTRILSTSEYGQYHVFNSWLQVLTIIITLNLFAGVFEQGLVKFEKSKNTYSSSLLGLSTIIIIVWTLVYLLFHNFWNNLTKLTTVQMLAMLSIIFLTTAFNFWSAYQKNEYKYISLVIVSLLSSILNPIISIVLINFSTNRVNARIFGILIAEFISYSWLYLYLIKRGKKVFDLKVWKYALAFNIPLIPHYLSQVILNSADRIMIERIDGSSHAGVYSLAYTLSMLMIVINVALMQALSPWIYRKIKTKAIKEISRIAYLSLITIAVLNTILISFAPEAVRIFAPSQYFEAIWIVPPVSISVYYMFCYDLFARFSFYFEKRGFIACASIVCAFLNIVLNLIFIKKYGYIAAGYTTLVCYILYALCHYLFMKNVCKKNCNGIVPYSGKIILLISITFTGVGLAMLLTYNHNVIRYSIFAVILIAAIVFRKIIVSFVKSIIIIRKSTHV